jgi:hypothetical protein
VFSSSSIRNETTLAQQGLKALILAHCCTSTCRIRSKFHRRGSAGHATTPPPKPIEEITTEIEEKKEEPKAEPAPATAPEAPATEEKTAKKKK